jgi:hypothetical protein
MGEGGVRQLSSPFYLSIFAVIFNKETHIS